MKNLPIYFLLNNASASQITEHLLLCDTDFIPPLSGRVVLNEYAEKIVRNAIRFEAWSDGTLVGLVAGYCNDKEKGIAYITSVSVLKAWAGKGIATSLMEQCVTYVKASNLQEINLEVSSDNIPAIRLYTKVGFTAIRTNATCVTMNLYLKSEKKYE